MSEKPEDPGVEKAPEPAPAPAPAAEVIAPVEDAAKDEKIEKPQDERESESETETETEKPRTPEPSFAERLDAPLTLLVLVAGIALLAMIQLSTPQLIDHDSLYHVGAAHALAHHGDNILTKRLFPWMQGTFLRDAYADKELLFHAVLMPFCSDARSMDENAKYATIVFGALALGSFVLVIRGAGIRHGWLWLLLLLGTGENFTYRLLQTRPHLVSIAIVLVATRFILQRRSLPLYFLGFLLSWSYSGPQVLPALALVALVARWVRAGDIAWKPLVASTLGVGGGLVLNPFVPNNLYLWYVQNVQVLLRAWGITPTLGHLGAELAPHTTRELLRATPGLCLTLALCAGALVLARRRPSVRTATLGGMAVACLAALFASAKFLDYAAPFAVLFAASAIDDQWRGGERSLSRTASATAFVLLAASLALFATARTHKIVLKYFGAPPPLRGAAAWLAGNAKGTTVIHFDWNDFSTLFHDNPSSFYLCGLDPTFMEVTYPEVSEYLEAIRHGSKALVARWFTEFKDFSPRARFIVVKQNTDEAAACFTTELQAASLKNVYEDNGGAVFAILGD